MTLELQNIKSLGPQMTIDTQTPILLEFKGFSNIDFDQKPLSNISVLSTNTLNSQTITMASNIVTPMILSPGNLSIAPAGTGIDLNSKILGNILTLQANLLTSRPLSNLFVSSANGFVDFTNTNIKNCPLITSGTDLTLSAPLGVKFGNSALSNISSIVTDTINTDSIGFPKIPDIRIRSLDPTTLTFETVFAGPVTLQTGTVNTTTFTASFANIAILGVENFTSLGNISLNGGFINTPASNLIATTAGVERFRIGAGNLITSVPVSIMPTGNSGVMLRLGRVGTADSVASPVCIDLGSSVSPIGTGTGINEQKLRIYTRDNGDFAGTTFTNDGVWAFQLTGPANVFSWRWNYNTNNRMTLDGAGNLTTPSSMASPVVAASTRVTTPLVNTSAGDLTVSPAGNNVNFSLKNITNVNNLSSANLTANLLSVSEITSPANLIINPTGNVDVNNKSVNGVARLAISAGNNSAGTVLRLGAANSTADLVATPICIDSGSGAPTGTGTTYDEQKWRLYSRSNGDWMGFSMNNSGAFISSFGGPNGGSYFWQWFANGNLRMTLTNAGQLQLASVQTSTINTSAGDLSLIPVGTNINVNNKTITNISNLSSTGEMAFLTNSPNGFRWASGGNTMFLNSAGELLTTGRMSSDVIVGFTRVTTPSLTTTTGNLSVNPAGTSVDFNGKNIINAVIPSLTRTKFYGRGNTLSSTTTAVTSFTYSPAIGSRLIPAGEYVLGSIISWEISFTFSRPLLSGNNVTISLVYGSFIITSFLVTTTGDYNVDETLYTVAASGAVNNAQIWTRFSSPSTTLTINNSPVIVSALNYSASATWNIRAQFAQNDGGSCNVTLNKWSLYQRG